MSLLQQTTMQVWTHKTINTRKMKSHRIFNHPTCICIIGLLHYTCHGLAFSLSTLGHHRRSKLTMPRSLITSSTATSTTRTSVHPCTITYHDADKQDMASPAETFRAILPFLLPEYCRQNTPAESLRRGEWFKLICGASFEVTRTSETDLTN